MKKNKLFSKIESRDDAVKIAAECGNGFFCLAALQGAIGAFLAPSLIVDAVIIALCGYFVRFKFSRIAAVITLILSIIMLITTFMNKFGHNVGGGNNIFLAIIFTFAAVRAVETTFKLNGRFKNEPITTENT